MKKVIKFLPYVFVTLIFTACSPQMTVFTSQLYQNNNWSDVELRQIQFYLSNDLVLQRRVEEGVSDITNGKIRIINGERIEEVIIKRGTPGVFLFKASSSNFAISFSDSDKRYLMFGANPKKQGAYVLLASGWQNRFGKVQYDEKTWETNEEAILATLLVDLKKIKKRDIESRTEQGRKIE